MPLFFVKQKSRSESTAGVCRVKYCRSYGRFMKNIRRHVKEQQRSMSFREHQWLPTPSEADYLEKVYEKHYMSYRKIEHCYVRGCRNFGQPYRNLAQHLRSQHNLEKSDYNRLVFHDNLGLCLGLVCVGLHSDISKIIKILVFFFL